MNQRVVGFVLLIAAASVWYMSFAMEASLRSQGGKGKRQQPADPCKDGRCPAPDPSKPNQPRPKPWGANGHQLVSWQAFKSSPWSADISGATVGGNVAPDGTEINVDLPGDLHRKNTSSPPGPGGLGLCVFTSIHHAAVFQNVPQLVEFPRWMIDQRIEGGGYPTKVREMIARISKDRGTPEPSYLQIEGPNTMDILALACRTGRMPSVTYCMSPTGRYGRSKISHMVNLVHCDSRWCCILDNNFPGADKYEWMTPDEFRQTYAPGWAVILLAPSPPPPPRSAGKPKGW